MTNKEATDTEVTALQKTITQTKEDITSMMSDFNGYIHTPWKNAEYTGLLRNAPLGNGDIYLKQPYTNFDGLLIISAYDDETSFMHCYYWDRYLLDMFLKYCKDNKKKVMDINLWYKQMAVFGFRNNYVCIQR